MNVPDPYKVLQVEPDADDEVIKAAYKHLARRHHPDVSRDPDAFEKMVRINQAWEMLRDPVRRAAVDRARARAAGTSARVVAADGKARAASRTPPAGTPARGPQRDGEPWPFPGMQDPSTGPFSARTDHVSGNRTSGRSTTGSTYDTRTMGAGAAGPPPGNPSGSLVQFGRYNGWTLGEIARVDLEYLEWLDRMPIGRTWQPEIDGLLRKHGRRVSVTAGPARRRGLFRRR